MGECGPNHEYMVEDVDDIVSYDSEPYQMPYCFWPRMKRLNIHATQFACGKIDPLISGDSFSKEIE